jgi:hypothetical protein
MLRKVGVTVEFEEGCLEVRLFGCSVEEEEEEKAVAA